MTSLEPVEICQSVAANLITWDECHYVVTNSMDEAIYQSAVTYLVTWDGCQYVVKSLEPAEICQSV